MKMKAAAFCCVLFVMMASLCRGADQVMRITDENLNETIAEEEFLIVNYSSPFVAKLLFTVDSTTYAMFICKSSVVDFCPVGISFTRTPDNKELYQFVSPLTSPLWLSFTTDGNLTFGKGSVIGEDSLYTSAEASNSQIMTITNITNSEYDDPWLDIVGSKSGTNRPDLHLISNARTPSLTGKCQEAKCQVREVPSGQRGSAMARSVQPRATVQDKAAYQLRLKELLREVDIPFDVFSCRPFECVCEDHRRMLEQYYSDVMSAMITASKECIPSRSKKKAALWSTNLLAAYLSCDASSLCMLGAPLSNLVQDPWKRSVSDGEAALASAVAELRYVVRDVVPQHSSSIPSIAKARRLLLEVCLSEV
ncbi:hypothetical protein CAPTEDRAFT_192251 [Capitella teleta]|uniref:Uncharacterized protein n=1 Tax=Capitella teleta TaxID=283909 RepID=R7UL43_CAPTE|nr:hypothetical protein CAPTEDRAFT_192251 [Capitella teleta]|eukprot:ELU04508.1 hypothetical protein CAPTEDRAFT_192251 [Capitella teleta]